MSRLNPPEHPVTIELDGRRIVAEAGEPVAAALVAAGELLFSRSPKYHRPRGPFCLSGGCSHCLMRVDGVPNVPICRTAAREGMCIERQNAMPSAELDLLRATDVAFRDWFNHHEFLTGLPIAEAILVRVARQLSGLGLLPTAPSKPVPPARAESADIVILGGGPAGLGTAQGLEAAGRAFLLLEREAALGGRRLWGPEGDAEPFWTPPATKARLGTQVVGLYADDGRPFLVTVEERRVTLLHFERLVLATGGHAMLPTFPNNDLPGVMAARAVSRLLRRHGVLAGARVACVGDPAEAEALATLVRRAGGTAVAVGHLPVSAHGLRRVTAVTVREGSRDIRHDCDIVALCGPVAPAFELARAAGANVRWDARSEHFVVEADADGRTSTPWLFAAGEVLGPTSIAGAADQGARVAAALLLEARP